MIQSLFEHRPENEISYLNYHKSWMLQSTDFSFVSSFKEDTWQIIAEVKKWKSEKIKAIILNKFQIWDSYLKKWALFFSR